MERALLLSCSIGERTIRLKFTDASGLTAMRAAPLLADTVGRFVLREFGGEPTGNPDVAWTMERLTEELEASTGRLVEVEKARVAAEGELSRLRAVIDQGISDCQALANLAEGIEDDLGEAVIAMAEHTAARLAGYSRTCADCNWRCNGICTEANGEHTCDAVDEHDAACPQFSSRSCRVCGCTEDNCQRCIERTGEPCHWVEEDLCSACVDIIEEIERRGDVVGRMVGKGTGDRA